MQTGDYILCERCGHNRKVTPELVEHCQRIGVRSIARSRGLFVCVKCGDRWAALVTKREYDELFKVYRRIRNGRQSAAGYLNRS